MNEEITNYGVEREPAKHRRPSHDGAVPFVGVRATDSGLYELAIVAQCLDVAHAGALQDDHACVQER